MGKPRPRVYFLSFQSQILQKTVGISEIRTQIVRVEGEHADHLTTTTAQSKNTYMLRLQSVTWLL